MPPKGDNIRSNDSTKLGTREQAQKPLDIAREISQQNQVIDNPNQQLKIIAEKLEN